MKKYIPTCHCADRDGFTTILHNHAFVGITTQFLDNGVFVGNMAAHVENNFCPKCGAPREIIDSDDPAEEDEQDG